MCFLTTCKKKFGTLVQTQPKYISLSPSGPRPRIAQPSDPERRFGLYPS